MKKLELSRPSWLDRARCSAAGLCLAVTTVPASALNFNFSFLSDSTLQANQAFMEAGVMWSSWITDPVTVNLLVGTAALGTGTMGSASSSYVGVSYSSLKSALTKETVKSAIDQAATAALPTGDTFKLLVNSTSTPSGVVISDTRQLDEDTSPNNFIVAMTSANARALDYTTDVTYDGKITFSNQFAWDYDRSNGITAGYYDFVGMAAHEIGHTLGFFSGVDFLITKALKPNLDLPLYASSLDLFRYSTESAALGAIDWTADARDKYFSLDGGQTALGRFSTGFYYGDGYQASHWKDNLGLGLMDPTVAAGEMLFISSLDLMAFDAIGWDIAPTPVPAPLPVLGAVAALAWSRKFRQRIRQASAGPATTLG